MSAALSYFVGVLAGFILAMLLMSRSDSIVIVHGKPGSTLTTEYKHVVYRLEELK